MKIKELVNKANQDNIIFKEYGIKPSEIAISIVAVANTDYDSGYIIIGAKYEKEKVVVNGISRTIRMSNIIESAVRQLNTQPKISFSMQSIEGKNVCIIKVEGSKELVILENASSDSISSPSSEEMRFVDKLFLACVKLQRNPLFYDVSEDQRNDFIRDILETARYQIKDQTRQGLSGTGVSTGEVDLLVQSNGWPLCVVEALNLKSLNKSYLNLHLDKIFNYDTLGNKFNVILSYVTIGDFGDFWDKYRMHIKNYLFTYQLIECDEKMLETHHYTDIKYLRTTHERNGSKTYLWHICVAIHSK